MEFNLAVLHQAIAAAVPDREAIIWRDRRLTWAELAERAQRFANLMVDHGLGVCGELDNSQPWVSPHDHMGLYLYNGPEFLEAVLGAHLARLAPFNVNYRYVEQELAQLLSSARPRVVVFHARLAPTLGGVLDQLPDGMLLLQVADDSGNDLLPGALDYETALRAASPESSTTTPTPDDLHIVYTGGTTGLPKGVLWRIGDVLRGPMAHGRQDGTPYESLEEAVAAAVKRSGLRILPAPPFIHGAGLWVAMTALASGGTVVIQDDPVRFDAVSVAALAERERVVLLSLVGDAMARPLLDALDAHPRDLAVRFLSNSAAPLGDESKRRLRGHIPGVRIGDGLGSSEAGHLGARATEATFALTDGALVLSEDRTRVMVPGEDEVGWLCTGGHHARGYLDEPERTRETFTVFDGRSLVVSGDRARLRADGTVELLGRDSMIINTGGEKVFAEEVEQCLRRLAPIVDAAVLGQPSERWGNEVVAVVQMADGVEVCDDELREAAAQEIARYKLPRVFVRAEAIRRGPNGKLDYAWARGVVSAAVDGATRTA